MKARPLRLSQQLLELHFPSVLSVAQDDAGYLLLHILQEHVVLEVLEGQDDRVDLRIALELLFVI